MASRDRFRAFDGFSTRRGGASPAPSTGLELITAGDACLSAARRKPTIRTEGRITMPDAPEDAAADVETDQPTDAAPEKDAKPETDWQAEARKWEKRAKDNMAKLKDAEPKISEYDRLIEASKSDLERKAEEAARWQQEATQWRTAAVSSRIHSLAGDFADPEDAVASLAAEGKYLDAGGVIDDAAIKTDLAALLERKPHWRRQQEPAKPRVPAPNAHQGSGNTGKSGADPRQEFAALLQAGLNR